MPKQQRHETNKQAAVKDYPAACSIRRSSSKAQVVRADRNVRPGGRINGTLYALYDLYALGAGWRVSVSLLSRIV